MPRSPTLPALRSPRLAPFTRTGGSCEMPRDCECTCYPDPEALQTFWATAGAPGGEPDGATWGHWLARPQRRGQEHADEVPASASADLSRFRPIAGTRGGTRGARDP